MADEWICQECGHATPIDPGSEPCPECGNQMVSVGDVPDELVEKDEKYDEDDLRDDGALDESINEEGENMGDDEDQGTTTPPASPVSDDATAGDADDTTADDTADEEETSGGMGADAEEPADGDEATETDAEEEDEAEEETPADDEAPKAE